jgi:hypothetical protein
MAVMRQWRVMGTGRARREDVELVEELVGLSEEAAEYRAFWRSKHGREYRAMVLGGQKKWEEHDGVEGEGGRRRRRREMKGMRWRWMEWLQARWGPQTKRLFYLLLLLFCSVFVFILFVMAFFLFILICYTEEL